MLTPGDLVRRFGRSSDDIGEGVHGTMTDEWPQGLTHALWGPGAYGPQVTHTAAFLLARSRVAPLVAAARGYDTLDSPAQVAEFAQFHGLGGPNRVRHKKLLQLTKTEALLLPWYRADLVAQAHLEGREPQASDSQLRPSTPLESETGVLVRYVMVVGNEWTIDMHPATPRDWYTSSPQVLLTQGVVAGDAALTAVLRESGVTDAELDAAVGTRADAVQMLQALMLQVPTDKRITVLSRTEARGWRNSEVWEKLAFDGREFVFTIDGTPDTDWASWNQLSEFWDLASSGQASASFLDFNAWQDYGAQEPVGDPSPGPTSNAAPPGEGFEGFFAGGGSLTQLLARRRVELPVRPARQRDDSPIGEWRVTEDGNAVEQLVREVDAPPLWKTMVSIGGRIAAMETHRAPTRMELQTGRFGARSDTDDVVETSTCRIEVRWLDEEANEMRAVVSGPSSILNYPPSKWPDNGAHIPDDLLLHTGWPPQGMDWVKAVKKNTAVPRTRSVRWTTMGWVPVEGSPVCSFISGGTIISPTEDDRIRTLPGVTNQVLPRSSGFSLPEMESEVMSAAWKTQVRRDLSVLREAFIDQNPWTNVNIAALVLAAGMRPAVPVDCTTAIWLQGAPGSGKSWTASMMLSFHQARETWNEKHLPASLKDTPTSAEQALAQSNIWVMDDLAPSSDRRSNDVEQAKIGDIVRSVHNTSAKRRSGVDLKARQIFVPHALLVVTSENEHTISSVRDRTIIVDLGLDSLRSDAARDSMVRFRDHDRAAGRLLVAAVQAFQYQAGRDGWASVVEGLIGLPPVDPGIDDEPGPDGSIKAQYSQVAKKIVSRVVSAGKVSTRHEEMAVDLMLGLAPLAILAELVEDTQMSELLSPDGAGSLPARVAAFAASSFRSQAEVTPGAVLIEAIRNILAAGYAHIENAHDATLPPLPFNDLFGNRALGWSPNGQGKLRPLGESIGALKTTRGVAKKTPGVAKKTPGGATDTIMLNATNAFARAQRYNYRTLPPGTSSRASFESIWNEGRIHPGFVDEREDRRVDLKYHVGGLHRRGVPIHINEILGDPIGDELGEI